MPKPTTTITLIAIGAKLTPMQKLQHEVQALRKPLTLPGITYDILNTDDVINQMTALHQQAVERSAHIEGRHILHALRIIKRYREIISYQEL